MIMIGGSTTCLIYQEYQEIRY